MFRKADEPRPASRQQARLSIGVLTFHRCINYGSYWQARCLVEGLRARGHDAVLLDHVDPGVRRTEWRCALQPLLPRRSSRADIRRYAIKTRRMEAAIAGLPLSAPFPLSAPEAMARCDLVIVGSDEVWNFAHPWYGGRRIFFGEGVPAPRIASYAASFGNHDAAAGIAPGQAQGLDRFAAISVRDDNSQQLVKAALGEGPPLVLDPCLQFPPRIAPLAGQPAYAAVYGHGFPQGFGTAAREWAAARSLRLVSIGYRNDWADENRLEAGPHEFAAAMAGAAAVLTTFFHGCVFALLNDKPFACAPSPYRMNKVRDLTRAVDAGRHLLPDGDFALAKALDAPLSPAIHDAIARLREQSDRYLDAILA